MRPKKRLSAIKNKRNKREYQRQTLQSYNFGDIFAKLQEKTAKLKQKKQKNRVGNMKSLLQTKFIFISSACFPSLLFYK